MIAAAPRIVLTGPGGWIGSAMLARIARTRGPGWADGVLLFGSRDRQLTAPDGTRCAGRRLTDLAPDDVDGAVVVHLAYLTKEQAAERGERGFTDTNLGIDDVVLAALAGARPRAVFVASSGAAALAADGRDRHPYGLTKLRQEDRFLGYGAALGIPVLVGRIFNLAGPYINKIESYAIGSFCSQALSRRSIRIDAVVPVFRSFLHVDDLCALALAAGTAGVGRAGAIDLCGSEVLEMGDLAAIAARHVAARIGGEVTVSRDLIDPLRPSVYLGDPTETACLAMQVGHDLTRFERQIGDTLAFILTTTTADAHSA